jgi:hypothetical protein
MLKLIGKLFAKIGLSVIIKNISLDIETVEKSDGYYLRVLIEVFNYKLLDEYVKLAGKKVEEQDGKPVLRLHKPISAYRSNDKKKVLAKMQKQANHQLAKVSKAN